MNCIGLYIDQVNVVTQTFRFEPAFSRLKALSYTRYLKNRMNNNETSYTIELGIG